MIACVYVFYFRIVYVLVLFDSGATRSFVSLALSKRFARSPRELDYPLDVEIDDDRSVRVVRVHQGCTLQLFSEQYFVDLVPIPLHGNKVIVGMYWFSPNEAVINYEQQLVVDGERSQHGPILCSAARARCYL